MHNISILTDRMSKNEKTMKNLPTINYKSSVSLNRENSVLNVNKSITTQSTTQTFSNNIGSLKSMMKRQPTKFESISEDNFADETDMTVRFYYLETNGSY